MSFIDSSLEKLVEALPSDMFKHFDNHFKTDIEQELLRQYGRGNLVDKGYGSLDFIAKSKLGSKLNVSIVIKNILDPKIERVQENTAATINVLSYKKGISAGFSLNYQF
jgi:hypothetical protein